MGGIAGDQASKQDSSTMACPWRSHRPDSPEFWHRKASDERRTDRSPPLDSVKAPPWLNRTVWGMAATSLLSDLGHEAQGQKNPWVWNGFDLVALRALRLERAAAGWSGKRRKCGRQRLG